MNLSESAILSLTRSSQYRLTQEQKRTAFANYNYAGCKLELMGAEERAYELASQAIEFVGDRKFSHPFGEITEREREIAIAAARYVISGRTDNPDVR